MYVYKTLLTLSRHFTNNKIFDTDNKIQTTDPFYLISVIYSTVRVFKKTNIDANESLFNTYYRYLKVAECTICFYLDETSTLQL